MEKDEIEKLRHLPIQEDASQLGLQLARHKRLSSHHRNHETSL